MGGEFVLNHERVPLDLDLPDFRGRLEGRPEGGIAGHVSFGPGQLKVGSAPELPVGTEIDVVVHRGVVDVQGARLIAEKTNLSYHGRIRLAGRPQGQLSLAGQVDLGVLERHVFRIRTRLRRLLALGWAPLDRRLPTADRGSDGGHGRRRHGRRRPPFRGLAVVRRHGRAGDARSRRGRPGGRGPARRRRAARGDAPSRPHPRSRARGRRRGARPHDLRLGRDAPGNRRHRRGGRELAPGKDTAPEREDRGGPRRAGGRTLPPLRAPRLARRGRAPDLRAGGAARVGDERPRQRRGRRGGSRPPRGRGHHRGHRSGRGRVHPGPPGARQPRGPGRGLHRGRHLPRQLAWHGGLAGLRGPLRGRARRLRRGRLGPRRVGGHPGHGGGGGPVAAARAPQGRGRDPMGRARRDRLARPPGRDRGPRPRLLVAGRGPRHVHGLGRGRHRSRDRGSADPRPAQLPAGRGEGHGSRRPVQRDSLRPRPHRVALEGTPGRGDAGRRSARRRHRRLPGQRHRRRCLRRRGRDGRRRSRSARALARAGHGLRRSALRPPRDAGHPRRGPACARASPRPASSSATRASARSRRAWWGPATAGSRSTGVAAPLAWTWPWPAAWAPRRLTRPSSPSPRNRRASTPSSGRSSRAFPRRSPSWPPGRCSSMAPCRPRPRSGRRPSSPTSRFSCPSFPSGPESPCGSRSPVAGSSSATSTWPGRGPTSR